MKTFEDFVDCVLGEEKFLNLAEFINICGTSQTSSADAERGFSSINNIKTKPRNRLKVNHLGMLTKINFYLTSGQKVDLVLFFLFLFFYKFSE